MRRTYTAPWRVGILCLLASTWVAQAAPQTDVEISGFETGEDCEWLGPWGGGVAGGVGQGAFVTAQGGDFVRSGERALRLSVWDNGASNAVGWAFLAQRIPCASGTRVRAAASFYASSSVMPLQPGATAQMRLEYYYDDSCESQIPTHVMLSEPFLLSAERKPDRWHEVNVQDRVPSGAVCLKFSIVLISEHPGSHPGAVWVDDTRISVTRAGARTPDTPAAAAKPPPEASRSWWYRLFH